MWLPQVHHVRVKGGPNGYRDFVADIQSIFGITTEHDMQLAFDCADPMTGETYFPEPLPVADHSAPLRALCKGARENSPAELVQVHGKSCLVRPCCY